MTLTINTSDRDIIILSLLKGEILLAKKTFSAHRQQSEKLLPGIDKLLQENKVKLADLKKIIVTNIGGSFTSLRIGVVTANALAYALKIPIESPDKQVLKTSQGLLIVAPKYDQEPMITVKKKII
jgi:tRNA threonylcarbamoyladenosine biosynthesis protein TsaB